MKTSKIAIYKPKVLLIKRVRKLIPILIIVVLLSASFSPAILAKKAIKDSSQVHRIKTLTNDSHADKPVKTMFVKLAERLVERFPKLASLPIFQRILNDNNSSLGDSSSSDDSNKGFMDKFLDNHPKIKSNPIFQRFLDDEEQSNSGETPTNNGYYTGGSGGNNDGSMVFEYGDISSLEDVNGTDNSTKYVIPEAGHLQISGNVSMEIANGMFYIQNHTVLLSGKFYLESEDDSINIWWNLTQGFFKINGSRHFEIKNLYFDVDGKLIVNINSLIIIDSQGYFTIDRFGNDGGLFFNGVRELNGVSVNINVEKNNVTFSGSFDLSSTNQAKGFKIYWGENGFSTGGSYNGYTQLDIHDLHIVYSDYEVSAGLASIRSSTNIEFKETDVNTLCSIVSDDFEVSDLYLKYGNKTLFVNHVNVHGSINLTLNIDGTGDEFVTAEAGHIILTGNTVMNVNTTVNVNGTIVKLQGEFRVKTSSDSINIWWNTTQGFLKITSTSLSVLGNLHVSIGEDWLDLNLGDIVMNSGASITLDRVNGHSHLKFDGIINLRGFTLNGDIKDNSIELYVGSIYFGANGNVDLFWNNGTSNVTAYAHCDYGLTIHNISFSAAGITGEISVISLQGNWRLEYNTDYLLFTLSGSIKISGFSLAMSSEDADVSEIRISYLSASGSVKILVKGGIIELWLSGGSSLSIGKSPVGPVSLAAGGRLHAIIDLATGEIHGDFGFGGWVTLMGIGAVFSGQGYFYLEGDWFRVRMFMSIYATLSMTFSFHIQNISIYVDVWAEAWASAWASVDINLKTGEVKFRYGFGINSVHAVVNGIYGEGTNVSIPTKYFTLKMDTFLLDARDAEISVWIPGLYIMGARFSGRVPGTVEIRNLTMMSTTNLSKAPMMLNIDRIYAKGDFVIKPSTMDEIIIEGDAHIALQNLVLNAANATDSNTTFNINLFIDRISLDSGQINISINNVLYAPEVSITATGASVEISDIGFSGNVTIPGEEDNSFLSLDFETSMDSVALENGELSISMKLGSDFDITRLDIEGSGTITVSGISIGGQAANETAALGFISASIDNITLDESFSINYAEGNLTVEASAALTIEDVDINGEFGDTPFGASLQTADFTLAGSLNVYSNGTVEAECEGSLVVEGVTVSIGEEEVTIENINIEFGGSFKAIPGETEDEPPVFEVNGHVEWNITGGIESEGEVDVDGDIIIQIQNDSDGNITLINISFDGRVNMNVSLNGFFPGMGNFSIDIQNYSGEGMFKFYWNATDGRMYMNNFLDATWDNFSFSLFDGFINGDIHQFYGDITIENLTLDRDILNNLKSVLNALNESGLNGFGDPDNWTIHSETGYQTVFGFSFSSEVGENIEGDINVGQFGIQKLYCEPGTSGRFEVNVDEEGNFNITFTTTSGYAEIDFSYDLYIFGSPVKLKFNLNSDDKYVDIPLGDVLRFLDDLQDKEWSDLSEDFPDVLRALGSLKSITALYDGRETSFYEWLKGVLQNILDQGDIPDWVREKLEDLMDWLEENDDTNDESCFLAGTKIAMADGSLRSIEEIRVGDLVKSYDPDGGEFRIGVVTEVFHHSPEEMPDCYLVINGDLRVTPNHPVFVDGKWIDAGELKIGDVFGGNIIYSIERIYRRVPTYNFEVEPYHTYSVVWGSGVASVVHNAMQQKNASEVKQVVTGDKHQHKSCFLRGTKIEMADGSSKRIEDIRVGDLVKSYDSKYGRWRVGVVTQVFHHSPSEMTDYYLVLNHDLRVTPNHPVFVDGRWVDAGELKIGDVFGGNLITSIERVYSRVPTYNFEVEPYHTYNVVWGGDSSSVVHNAMAQKNVSVVLKQAGISGDKYQSASVKADAGAKTKVEISKKLVVNGTKKIVINKVVHVVPKTYENKKGQKVKLDDITVVVNENGEYSVQKKQQSGKVVTVKKGLKSSEEVVNYIEKSVVNKDSSSSHQNSDNNNNNDDEDDDDDDDETCCFPAGTMITMADGELKPIEKVRVGDFVLSYDVKDHRATVCKVLETVAPVRAGVYSINNGLVYVTDDHPFYTLKKNGYVGWAAINPERTKQGYSMSVLPLEVGDKLFTQDGRWIAVQSIEYKPGPIQTYNLEDVSGKSTFFANGLLVHNAVQCVDSSETVENDDSNDNGGVSYSYYDESSGSLCCETLMFDDTDDEGDSKVTVDVPLEFDGSGTYIADKGKEKVNVAISGVVSSTKVVMADGSVKNVESLRSGDLVKSFDPVKKRIVNARVTGVSRHSVDDGGYVVVRFTSGYVKNEHRTYDKPVYPNVRNAAEALVVSHFDSRVTPDKVIDVSNDLPMGELRVTPDTLVYVKLSSGVYKEIAAGGLKPGCRILSVDGRELSVQSVQRVFKKTVVYTVDVGKYDAYFANGVLVNGKTSDGQRDTPKIDENEIVTYIWDFGDGTVAYGEKPRHVFHADVPLDGYKADESGFCMASFDGPKTDLRDVDAGRIPGDTRISKYPWTPSQPTITKKTTTGGNGKPTVEPVYELKEVTYPVTLIAIDKYGRVGVDTTEVTVTVPIPVALPLDGYIKDVGYKNIEDVKVGDWVKTIDLKSKRIVDAKVTEVVHHTAAEAGSYYLLVKFTPELNRVDKVQKQRYVDSVLSIGDYTLEVAPDHPVCVVTSPVTSAGGLSYKWVLARNLRVGDVTYSVTGERVVVSSIQKVYKRVDTYNIRVETYGTYFANGVLVQDKTFSTVHSGNIGLLAGTQVLVSKGRLNRDVLDDVKDPVVNRRYPDVPGYPNVKIDEIYSPPSF